MSAIVTIGCYLAFGIGNYEQRQSEHFPTRSSSSLAPFTWFPQESYYNGSYVSVLLINGNTENATPPGLTQLPKLGTSLVSPHLNELIKTDPTLADRIPGEIVGELPVAALNSPTSLQAIAHTPAENTFYEANDWGQDSTTAADAIPYNQTLYVCLLLIFLPSLLLLFIIASLKANYMEETIVRLAKIGVNTDQIKKISRGQIYPTTPIPLLTGIMLGTLLAWKISSSKLIGTSFFMPPVKVMVIIGLVLFLVLTGCFTITTRWRTKYLIRCAFLAGSKLKRIDHSLSLRNLPFLALGIVVLIIIYRWITQATNVPPNILLLVFVILSLLLAIGSHTFTLRIIDNWTRRTQEKDPLAVNFSLRQLKHSPTTVTTQTLALTALGIIFTMSAMVQTIMREDATIPDTGSWWVASIPSASGPQLESLITSLSQQDRVIAMRAESDTSFTTAGSCENLIEFFGVLQTTKGMPCNNNQFYNDEALVHIDDNGDLYPVGFGSGNAIVITDTDIKSSDILNDSQESPGYLAFYTEDITKDQSNLLNIMPRIDFSPHTGNLYSTLSIPRISQVTTTSLILGLFAAITLLFLAMVGNKRFIESQQRLVALGIPINTYGQFSATRALIGSLTSAVVALTVCTAIGQCYLALVGTYTVSLNTFITYAAVLLGGVALITASSYFWDSTYLRGTQKATR